MAARIDTRLLQSLRFEAERRTFGLASPREREIARHFYLLALEEAERTLTAETSACHDAA